MGRRSPAFYLPFIFKQASPVTDLDIDFHKLNSKFRLKSLFPKLFLHTPMGVPGWWDHELRTIFFEKMTGTEVQGFESYVQNLFNVKHCLFVNSGRDALRLGFLASGLIPGDKVVVPNHVCLTVLNCILEVGAKPVLVNSDSFLQIDPCSVRKIVSRDVRALIVPHLFGRHASMPELKAIAQENGWLLIDDAAQCVGLGDNSGFFGSQGDFGVLSFGAFKRVVALGGGALLTDSDRIASKARNLMPSSDLQVRKIRSRVLSYAKLRFRGEAFVPFLVYRYLQERNQGNESGPPRIIQDFSPAHYPDVSLAKKGLELLPSYCEKEKWMAIEFRENLKQISYLTSPGGGAFGFPHWPVYLDASFDFARMKDFFAFMLKRGIEVQPGYDPLHYYLKKWGLPVEGDLACVSEDYKRILWLPFYPEMCMDRLFQALDAYQRRVRK